MIYPFNKEEDHRAAHRRVRLFVKTSPEGSTGYAFLEKISPNEAKGYKFLEKYPLTGVGAEWYVFLVGSNQLYEGSYFWSNAVQKTMENYVNFKKVRV